jgi:transposase InsO family protein
MPVWLSPLLTRRPSGNTGTMCDYEMAVFALLGRTRCSQRGPRHEHADLLSSIAADTSQRRSDHPPLRLSLQDAIFGGRIFVPCQQLLVHHPGDKGQDARPIHSSSDRGALSPPAHDDGGARQIYPYLLRGMEITRPNQVWAVDITYIPMARGFVYLAVVLDWFSRRVLSWRLSITMEAALCVETLEDAMARHGKPEVFNTDQGSQFTGAAFTGVLVKAGIAISMDGKGAWRDNVFVERLWRSVKYEEVYLRAYDSVSDARHSIGRYVDFYDGRRPHSSLDGATPDQAYLTTLPLRAAA